MQPAPFDYYRPATVKEAVGLLDKVKGARALAGGHSLLPAMKLRLSSPAALVDLGRIPGLAGIGRSGKAITIGALTTHAAVAASDVIRSDCPILAEAAVHIGDPAVRNRGTIGGSIAHADPAADYPPVLVALDATVVVAGAKKERKIPAAEFFTGIFTTALADGELVTAVEVPVTDRSGVYLKHPHPASGYAVVGVAALVKVDKGTCTAASLCVGGVTGKPERATEAEAALVGKAPSAESITTAAAKVAGALSDPLGDLYASGEYRVHLASVLAGRALTRAFGM